MSVRGANQVTKIDPHESFFMNKVTVLVGRRATGKTVYVKNEIFYKIQHAVDAAYVFLPDAYGSDDVNKYFLEEYKNMTDGIYSIKTIDKIYKYISEHREQKHLLIFDFSDCSDVIKNVYVREFLHNYRYLNVSVIMCMGHDIGMDFTYIDNYILCESPTQSKKRLFEKIGTSCRSFNEFSQLLDMCCNVPYNFLMWSRGSIVPPEANSAKTEFASRGTIDPPEANSTKAEFASRGMEVSFEAILPKDDMVLDQHEKTQWYLTSASLENNNFRFIKNNFTLPKEMRVDTTELQHLSEKVSQTIDELVNIRDRIKLLEKQNK